MMTIEMIEYGLIVAATVFSFIYTVKALKPRLIFNSIREILGWGTAVFIIGTIFSIINSLIASFALYAAYYIYLIIIAII